MLGAIVKCGQVGCCVEETTIRLADNSGYCAPFTILLNKERIVLRLVETIGEYADGTIAFAGNPLPYQVFHQRCKCIIVSTFA